MKFKIKIITYNNNKVEYTPLVYRKSKIFPWGYWEYINGRTSTNSRMFFPIKYSDRNEALDAIDNYIFLNHYKPYDVKSIDFEYLDKTIEKINLDRYKKIYKI